jgi:rod shape determining protein RodA
MHQKSIWDKLDWNTFYVYLALVIIGWLAIYAAEYQEGHAFIFNLKKDFGKQLMWIGVGLIVGLMILLIDVKLITALPYFLYGIILFVLVIVAVIAKNVNGANAWLDIGGFKLQPSEFSKTITALALAKFLSQSDVNFKILSTRLKAIALIVVPSLLIILQKDTGSALVSGAFMLVLYREGFPGYILVIGVSALVLLVAAMLVPKFILFGIFAAVVIYILYSWRRKLRRMRTQIYLLFGVFIISSLFVLWGKDFVMDHVLQKHQRDRIQLTFGITTVDKSVAKKLGYNVIQSKIAIGSGGFWGKGFLEGTQTQFNFVPEQSTDFIFCTIGEERGFVGVLVVLGLYGFLLLRILNIAERQRSKFSRIYGYSVASILFLHIFINVGMTIGLLPVIGIPLPFLSYGGSSFINFTILLFILLKLDTERIAVLR